MNIIVNGASGYIGYHLVTALLKKGHTVYALCRKGVGLLENIQQSDALHIVISEQCDAYDRFCGIDYDVWYQLAWEGSYGEMRSIPEIQVQNEILSVNAMQLAKEIGCKKIIYTGTVYEKAADDILANPEFDRNSFYIIAKKHAYEMTYQLSKKIGIDYVWCQFCQPAGKYMSQKQLIPYAVKCFMDNEPTTFGSCSRYFDIISVEYLANALIAIGENECKKNLYYIGSGDPKILREYISDTAEICGYGLEIGFGKRPDDGMIFKKEWFDCSDFLNEFGLSEHRSFEEIIKAII